MDKKIVFVLFTLIAVLALFLVSANDNPSDKSNRTILNVSSEGPLNLSKVIKGIKTNPLYEDCDNKTLRWMDSLGDKYVFTSSDEIVIMDKCDADKIPSIFICDVYIYEIISCNVLENRSLGDNHRDVLLVSDVEFIKQEEYHVLV
ncbi:hypothetical protein [Methanobrevibacter sp.]|uniref:hypothetical protein n=1 Tax=Methanobrevibacter sp. TaxID=66852 RepID=UPI0026E0E0A1|nr:hypothetical protein [Methanobrevibacter sp.]MDO5823719.1 hypothetical protein [Methanobrevibacter sp.]